MAKKTKKDAKSDATESDAEFFARIMKMKDDAQKKSKKEIESNSKEIEEYKQKGKEIGKDLEELEECEKISEEFKANPPVVFTKHINGVSVEYKYDDKYKSKIERLKKRGFGFLSATNDTSIFTPNVKTFGRAYVKRGGQRIILPEDSNPPSIGMGMGSRLLDPNNLGFVLKDGDQIVTEDDSYARVKDFISNDDYHRELFIFPNSEAVVNLSEKVTHPEPSFMVPSQVSDAIKKKCEYTVMNYNISKFLPVKGIFQVNLLDRNKNVNKCLELSSEYPSIEFLPASKTYEGIMNKQYEKLAAVPNAVKFIAAHKARMASQSKICDEIAAYLELCSDSSIVVFATMNSVRNTGSGKVASIVLSGSGKDIAFSGKITVNGDRIYSDKSGIADPRVKAIFNYVMAIGHYSSLFASKKEIEQTLKNAAEKRSKPKVPETAASRKEKEKRKAELLEEKKYYTQVGDTMMANATQMQLDEIDPPKETEAYKREKERMRAELLEQQKSSQQAGNTLMVDTIQMQIDMLDHPENADAISEEYAKKQLAWCDKELAKLRPSISTNFPPYNSPSETDAS